MVDRCPILNILKATTELYTLNRYIVWYVIISQLNYQKKKERKKRKACSRDGSGPEGSFSPSFSYIDSGHLLGIYFLLSKNTEYRKTLLYKQSHYLSPQFECWGLDHRIESRAHFHRIWECFCHIAKKGSSPWKIPPLECKDFKRILWSHDGFKLMNLLIPMSGSISFTYNWVYKRSTSHHRPSSVFTRNPT